MTPCTRIIALLCLFLGGLAGGWRLGADHVRAGQADAEKARAETLAVVNDGVAKAIAARLPAQQRTIERITRETIETPVYRECRHSPSSLRDLNAALAHSEPASAVTVPDADAP
jgi:hypothetical protein